MKDLVSCPYNKAHKVKQFKLLAHIHSCKDAKKYQPGEFLTCKKDVSIIYHISSKLEHDSTCKNCLGQELETIDSTLTIIDDGTSNKIELNTLEGSILFDSKNIITSEQFYKNNNLEGSILSKDNKTIIY
jgi:hypothetical protein